MTAYIKGFSFLEFILFLSLAAVVTLAGMTGYQANKTRAAKQVLIRHVDILLAATNGYYQAHCREAVIPGVSLSRLKDEGFIDTIPVHPLGGQYYMTISRTPLPSVQVQASVDLPNASQQVAFFGANNFSNNRLIWVRPIKTSSEAGQQTRTFHSMYEGDCI